MLTYEYQCEVCGLKFERRQAITDPSSRDCPKCGGESHRLISGGLGFIVTKKGNERPSDGDSSSCSFQESGTTCCGRRERCGRPPCGGGQ